MNTSLIDKAIRNLGIDRIFHFGDTKLIIACLVRYEDWRPLKAKWWKGKEVCVIGADIDGNFLLRHSDGSIRYWSHQTKSQIAIAKSVSDFMSGLQEDKDLFGT